MPQSDFGPINLTQGDQAEFSIEFTSSLGVLTVPSSATLTVTYLNTSNATQTDTVTTSLNGSFWVGTWSSTSALPGLANWSVSAFGSTSAVQFGVIRVIDP